MKEFFKDILDKDEEILKVYKPNKKRAVTIRIVFTTIWMAIFTLPGLLLSILGLTNAIYMVDENGVDGTLEFGITFLVISIIFILFYILIIVSIIVTYRKTFYAYSNKRIIIRQGFIGVDYATLDMSMIGTVLVNVGFLDKLIKPNTGTLRFGSTATPIGGANVKAGGGFMFFGVNDAYVTYREIKEVIDSHRESESKAK